VTRVDGSRARSTPSSAGYFIADFSNPPIFGGKHSQHDPGRVSKCGHRRPFWAASGRLVPPSSCFRLTYSRLAVTRGVAAGIPSPVSVGVKMAISTETTSIWQCRTTLRWAAVPPPSIFHRNQWQWADDMDLIRERHHYSFGLSSFRCR